MCTSTLLLELFSRYQLMAHLIYWSRSAWRSKWSAPLLFDLQISTPSADSNIDDLGDSGNSLTERRKRRGLKMVPWVTSLLTDFYRDSAPLVLTFFLQSHKTFSIHSFTEPVIPKLESFCIRPKCEKLSNDLLKFMNIISTDRPLLFLLTNILWVHKSYEETISVSSKMQ